MRFLYAGLVVSVLLIAFATRSSRSQAADPSTTGQDAEPEPGTSDPVWPAPGDESDVHEPFTMYDVGSPSEVTQLTADQAAATQAAMAAKDHNDWQQVNNAYAAMAAEHAQTAAAAAAANKLNAGDLSTEGVIK
ncbi:MAG TPA: hypothetical protein VH914_21435 [Acidimicrobiia bacterium]|jgi:hypothetical protein|nr:hypothetical protein [Acidimicrobiia bacterium]